MEQEPISVFNENNDDDNEKNNDDDDDDSIALSTLLLYGSVVVLVLLLLIALFIIIRRQLNKPKLAERVSTSLSRRSSGSSFRKRFFSKRQSTKIGAAQISRPIALHNFDVIFQQRLAQDQLNEEFRIIQEFTQSHAGQLSQRQGQLEVNRPKNRFVDVIPYDHSLVRLRRECGHPPSTYINASYITSTDGRVRWIATQTPMSSTTESFWTLIMEQRVSTIVCLTESASRDATSTTPISLHSHYWPDLEEELTLDELLVVTRSEARLLNGNLIVRKIRIAHACNNEGETMEVTHLHLTDWADHGVPHTTVACLEAVNALVTAKESNKPAMGSVNGLVHCSAGVGRTGALMAVVTLVDQIARQHCPVVDVMATVNRLREQRPKAVQTQKQYAFIYACLADFIRNRENRGHGRNVSEVEVDFANAT